MLTIFNNQSDTYYNLVQNIHKRYDVLKEELGDKFSDLMAIYEAQGRDLQRGLIDTQKAIIENQQEEKICHRINIRLLQTRS